MKKKIFPIIFILIAILLVHFTFSSGKRATKIGKVSYFVGDPQLKKNTAKKWKKIKLNSNVRNGDEIKTKIAQRVELTLQDGSVIRIAENSNVVINRKNKKVVPNLKKGKIWGNILKLGKRKYDFEVTTGTATAAIRGTIFRVDALPENKGAVQVTVYTGKVAVGPSVRLKEDLVKEISDNRKEVAGPSEVAGPFEVALMDWVSIVKGQRIDVMQNGKYAVSDFDKKKDAVDSWVKFNSARDKINGGRKPDKKKKVIWE